MSFEESAIGLKLLDALLKEDTSEFIQRGDLRYLFDSSNAELAIYNAMRKHVTLYGKLPHESTLLSETQTELLPSIEPADYYQHLAMKRMLDREIKHGVNEVDVLLKGKPGTLPDPIAAYEALRTRLLTLHTELKGSQLMDFRNAKDMVWGLYMQALTGGNKGAIELGWPYLDSSDMGSGLFAGDVVSFVGRPQRGKTWMMLWTAIHNWKKGKTPLFVSMEMDMQLIMIRLAAIYTHIEAKKIKGGNLSPTSFAPGIKSEADRLHEGLDNLGTHEAPFWVVDGNLTSSVDEIRTYAAQLDPDVVLIDGAYLLSHFDKRLPMHARVAANCELMKRELAASLRIPVIASFQFNRDAAKKMKKNEENKQAGKAEVQVDLEDIAHSDAIGQISSIVLGFFEDSNPENVNKKRIDVMKGRSGEQGVFHCNWDFNKMDFSEAIEKDSQYEPGMTFGDEEGWDD